MSRRLMRSVYVFVWLVQVSCAALLAWSAWTTVRDARGPNRLVVPLRVDHEVSAQVYFDTGGGLNEKESAVAGVEPAQAMRDVALPVPRVPIRALRFDPMSGAGKFELGRPRLETASGRVIARFPLSAVTPANEIARLTAEGGTLRGETVANAADPQLTLELGQPLRIGRVRWPWIEALAFASVTLVARRMKRREELRDFEVCGKAREWLRGGIAALRVDGVAGAWLGALVVCAGQAWLLWPLQRTLDWPLWDEANYAALGRTWAQHGGSLGQVHGSPFYVAMYAALAGGGELANAIFAQHYFVKLASTVLLFVALARWWRHWPAAVAVALAWGLTTFQLEFPLLVYQAAWVWFLAALVTIDRWPVAGVGFVALATLTRQEYQAALAVAVIWIAWQAWRKRWRTGEWLGRGGSVARWGGAVLALVVWSVVIAVAARVEFAGGVGRGWFAFQQHYAVRAVETGEVTGINPWLDYGALVQKDFPGATSLLTAARANPGAMWHHIAHNVAGAPLELVRLLQPHGGLGGAAVALLVAALAGLVGTNARREKNGWSTSAVVAGAALLVIAPGMIVLAKNAYLLPLIPLALGGLGWCWGRVPWPDGAVARGVRWGGLFAGALGLAWLVTSPQPFQPGTRGRPVREAVLALREVWPEHGRATLLGVGASSLAQYVGEERCKGIEAVEAVTGTGRVEDFRAMLTRTKPYAVIVTPEWRQSRTFDAQEFARALPESEWQRRELALGPLYWRRQ